MMSEYFGTSNVWPNYSTSNVQKAARTPTDTLGKDQFLSILVAQLRNQDPMSPMNDTEFIGQMAQFTSVEQLMNMSNELALMRQNIGTASSLIGKTVSWNEYDEAGNILTKHGIVESIVSFEGKLYVEVNGDKIGIDFINQISIGGPAVIDPEQPPEESTDPEETPDEPNDPEENNDGPSDEVSSS